MKDTINILVVDDEPIVIMSAERVLKAEGYNVEGVLSGREAIARLEQNNYDLVLTDLNMLGIDGLTLIKWIKQFRPATGIVVITGHLLHETIKEALKLGVNDHMMKPFSPAVLKDVISKTVEWLKAGRPDDACKEELPPSMFEEVDKVIHQLGKEPGSIIPILLQAQEIFGYLPPVVQKHIARCLNMYPAEINSIVSLHPMFRTKPRGDHTIRVCLGTSCYMKGGERILRGVREALKINPGQTTHDGKFTLESVRCVGACGRAPLMLVDEETHGPLTWGKAINSINKCPAAKEGVDRQGPGR